MAVESLTPTARKYLESVRLIERVHRQFLERLRVELERIGVFDVNNVQAVLLYNIGPEELSVRELTQRGHYQGSNVSYNLKKLIDAGYIAQSPSPFDRRSVRVKATDTGLSLQRRLEGVFERQAEDLTGSALAPQDLIDLERILRRIEQFWVTAGS